MEDAFNQMQELDVAANERGALLAFRFCVDGDEVEPVFVQVETVGIDEGNGAAMLAITDGRGMSLGRYVLPRHRLEAALAGDDVLVP